MADDPLDQAHAIGAARWTVGVNMAAEGAAPSTQAARDGHALEPGAIVYDPITGQQGVIHHARVYSVVDHPSPAETGDGRDRGTP